MASLLARTLVALALVLAPLGTAEAVVIPSSDKVGPSPAVPGDGLNGFFWTDFGPTFTNAAADAVIAGTAPTATFHSTAVDYPNGPATTHSSGNTLATHLGVDAGSLDPAAAGAGNILTTSLFRFTGFINILAEHDTNLATGDIDVFFTLGSDDGSRLRIGGVTVIDNGGLHAFSTVTNTANFAEPGLYPVEIIHYENTGVTGIEWKSSIGGAATAAGAVIVPAGVLYRTIPTVEPEPEPDGVAEPGVLLLLGGGLTALAGLARRRRP